VYGASGEEAVKLNQGVVGLLVDQNVERIQLPGSSGDYQYLQTGNQLKIYAADGSTLVATIPLQGDSDGTLLAFVDGTVSVKLAAGGVMSFGGATVSDASVGALVPREVLPRLVLTQSRTSVDEGSVVVYTVTSDIAAPSSGIIAPYTIGGIATPGADFNNSRAGTITIAAGATTGTMAIRPTADDATEGSETLVVTLGTPSYGVVVVDSVSTTVNDTSQALEPTQFALAGALAVNEGDSVTYTLAYGSTATSDIVVPYTLAGTATNGVDYTGSSASGNFTIKAGGSTANVTLFMVADALYEGTETIVMALGDLPSGTSVLAGKSSVSTALNNADFTLAEPSYSLTTNVDHITGSARDNNVFGTLSYAAGVRSDASNTFNTGDFIDGGAGNDTFYLTVSGATATGGVFSDTMVPALAAVERVLVSNTLNNQSSGSAAYHTDLSLLDSALAVVGTNVSTDSNTSTVFDKVGKLVDVEMRGLGDLAVYFTDTAVAGTADVLNLTLNYVGASANDRALFDADNIETLNIASSGAANALELGTDAGTGWTELASVNISGDQILDLHLGTGAGSVTAVDAAGNTAGMRVSGIAADKCRISGGIGNDVFNMGSGFNADDTIDGGDGSGDILIVTAASVSSSDFAHVSHVEILQLDAASANLFGNMPFTTIDLAGPGITTLTLGSGSPHDLLVSGFDASGGDKLNLNDRATAAGVNAAWYSLGGTAADQISTGDGVIFLYGTGFTSSEIVSASANAGTGHLFLSTGDVDYVVVLASGAGDNSLDIFQVNAATDGTSGAFAADDIVHAATLTLLGDQAAGNLAAANFVLV
jgi:hypothetical protein